jgi:hypothetical protein
VTASDGFTAHPDGFEAEFKDKLPTSTSEPV